jgi:hypothetical protein
LYDVLKQPSQKSLGTGFHGSQVFLVRSHSRGWRQLMLTIHAPAGTYLLFYNTNNVTLKGTGYVQLRWEIEYWK